LLVWIAYRLLTDDSAQDAHAVAPAMSFWAAMRTIVIADTVMGLDNVLAVAGAAHGSMLAGRAGPCDQHPDRRLGIDA
jgi:predicted tellurium resistance membrane protein TerC